MEKNRIFINEGKTKTNQVKRINGPCVGFEYTKDSIKFKHKIGVFGKWKPKERDSQDVKDHMGLYLLVLDDQ